MLGLNDALPAGQRTLTSPAEFQNNLLGLVDRIMALGARPVLIAPNRASKARPAIRGNRST